jgi:hypothetical protein
VDLTKLNKYVKPPVNPQPTPWKTVQSLHKGSTYFLVFDAPKGYHQIELDGEIQNLTVLMIHFSRYINLSLAFGLSSASDVFNLKYAIDDAAD